MYGIVVNKHIFIYMGDIQLSDYRNEFMPIVCDSQLVLRYN